MPIFESMSPEEATTRFPEMATAIACVIPFLKLFGEEAVPLPEDGRFIWLSSQLPIPNFHRDVEMWDAKVFPDRALVVGTRRKENWKWATLVETVRREPFTLAEFSDFLRKVSEDNKKIAKPSRRRTPTSPTRSTTKPTKGPSPRRRSPPRP
jgi:hypothetical protein